VAWPRLIDGTAEQSGGFGRTVGYEVDLRRNRLTFLAALPRQSAPSSILPRTNRSEGVTL
jgi:hypothetical protein